MSVLPSLRQLSHLVQLADRLNFPAAAEAQFVTQSTLSAGIKELESVERDQHHVRLTAIGEEIVSRSRGILAAARDLADTARSRRSRSPAVALRRHSDSRPLAPGILPPRRRAYLRLRLYLREVSRTDCSSACAPGVSMSP